MNGFSLRGIKWIILFCLIFLFFQVGCTKKSPEEETGYVQVNIGNLDNNTLLHIAISQGQLDAIKLLIEKGADVNAKNKNGSTPLRLAEIEGFSEIAEYIRQHGGK